MPHPTQHLYEFGPFRVVPAERLLLREGLPQPISPKVFDTLLVLLENHGHLVEKDELMRRVWPDTVVEEANLAHNVFTLRKVFGEENGTKYVETVPKRGYRFVGAVKEVSGHSPADVEAAPITALPAPPSRRANRAVVVALAVATVLGVTGYLASRPRPASPKPAAVRVRLAVLPIVNMTGNPHEDYFSDGLTEEMITQLSRLRPDRLAVIARTSAMHYKGTRMTAADIGRELGVDYILESSFRREGDRVRISSKLIRVKDQTQVWAENYDRHLRDVLALQVEVAQAIAPRIQIELTEQQQARLASTRAIQPDAYELYLQGRYFWNKRTKEGLQKSVEFFERAITTDPLYSQAYAGLADANALLAEGYGLPRADTIARARGAAIKALELDETLAEAHASLGFVRMQYDWEWTNAEKEFQRAIDLNPSYATAHHWYAYDLIAMGRTEDAVREIRRAEACDPISLIIKTDVAEILHLARRYDEAIDQARSALRMDPNFDLAYRPLAWALAEKGQYSEAESELKRAMLVEPRSDSSLAYVAARAGHAAEARKTLAAVKNPLAVKFNLVAVHAALGEKDAAFFWLERAFEERSGVMIFLRSAPQFDPLRTDPRYQDLLRRVDSHRKSANQLTR